MKNTSLLGLTGIISLSLMTTAHFAQAQMICMDPQDADYHLQIDVLGDHLLLDFNHAPESAHTGYRVEKSVSQTTRNQVEFANSNMSVNVATGLLNGPEQQGFAYISGGPADASDSYHCLKTETAAPLKPVVECKDISIEGVNLSRAEIYSTQAATRSGTSEILQIMTFDRKDRLVESFKLDPMYRQMKTFILSSDAGMDNFLSQDFRGQWSISQCADPDFPCKVTPVSCR